MKHRALIGALLLLAIPSLGVGQSLTELARQEKERRKKVKESGTESQVITDRELASNQGRIANPTSSTPSAEGTDTAPPVSSVESAREGGGASTPIRDDLEGVEDETVTDIPADASLEEKLSLLERMKTSYQQQVAAIDAEIEKNNQRLAEIENELVSTGGTGLPTAPQADRAVRNPGNIPALRTEQQELRDRNQALEAQKRTAKDDIIARGRRAGIPASYLNF
jgi:hypothetical protein